MSTSADPPRSALPKLASTDPADLLAAAGEDCWRAGATLRDARQAVEEARANFEVDLDALTNGVEEMAQRLEDAANELMEARNHG